MCEETYRACCSPIIQDSSRRLLEGLLAILTLVGTVCEAVGLTVSDKKTDNIILRTKYETTLASPLVIERTGQM